MTRRELDGIAKVIRGLAKEGVQRRTVAELVGREVVNRYNQYAWKRWMESCGETPRGILDEFENP